MQTASTATITPRAPTAIDDWRRALLNACALLRCHASRVALTVSASALIATSCGMLEANWQRTHAIDVAATQRLEAVYQGLSDVRLEATRLFNTTDAEEVADTATLTTLASRLETSGLALEQGVDTNGGNTWFDWAGMEKRAERNNTLADNARDETHGLQTAMTDVNASIELKNRQDAFAELESATADARKVHDAYASQVMDADVANALESALATADERLATAPEDATSVEFYTEVTTAVTDAKTAFDESHDAWVTYQQRLAAQRAAVSHASGGSYSTGSGSWSPSYVTAYGSQTAIDAGNLVQYAPGYFAGHRHLAAGQSIASRPQYVTVNGQRYQYAGTINVDKYNTTMDYATSWAGTGQGNIAFQTCNNDGQTSQINKYVPVG